MPEKFSLLALRFLRVLLNCYMRMPFGILSGNIKLLYELLLLGFVALEKLLCPDTTGVLLKAVYIWNF